MNLTSPSQVKSWCIEHEFHPNKTLGQNFLIDKNILEAIVDAGLEGAGEAPCILEIGPGLGVLTEEMLRRGARVSAIEKDPVLGERLAAELAAYDNFSLSIGDALDARIMAEAAEKAGAPFDAMVSNLPYQAGTRILLELVQAREIPSMTVLLQSEVAERLAAKEGSKARSLAGVWAQLDYDVKILRKVSQNSFWPRPEVGSSVARLVRHDRNIALDAEKRAFFHKITKKAFEHRRKQLASTFKNMIKSTRRAEELSVDEWIETVENIYTKG